MIACLRTLFATYNVRLRIYSNNYFATSKVVMLVAHEGRPS